MTPSATGAFGWVGPSNHGVHDHGTLSCYSRCETQGVLWILASARDGVPDNYDDQKALKSPRQLGVADKPRSFTMYLDVDVFEPGWKTSIECVFTPYSTTRERFACPMAAEMCLTVDTTRPRPARPYPTRLPANWHPNLTRFQFLRRGAVVPTSVTSHQIPLSYHPTSRRIIGTGAIQLYQHRLRRARLRSRRRGRLPRLV